MAKKRRKTAVRRRPRPAAKKVVRRRRRKGMSEAQRKEMNLRTVVNIVGHSVQAVGGALQALAINEIAGDNDKARRLMTGGLLATAAGSGKWGTAAGLLVTGLIIEVKGGGGMGENATFANPAALALAEGKPLFIPTNF